MHDGSYPDWTSWPLEPDPDEMREMVAAAMDRIVPHIEALQHAPAWAEEGGEELSAAFKTRFGDKPTPLPDLLDPIFDEAVKISYNTASPGYFAFVPGGGLFASAVADLIADAINRYVTLWFQAPGLVQIEADVVRWCADVVGFGAEAGGYLSTGGSMANLSAITTARREKLPPNFLDGVLYASTQAHHSVTKAAMLAGFPPKQIRSIDVDAKYRIKVDALRDAISADLERGLRPFCVIANGGTTNTGAIDPLTEIADLADEHDLWMHVDAAYGGFFALTERGRLALRGVDRADSVAMDPHKSLFLPIGTGSLVVQDRGTLFRAHSVEATDYLPEDFLTADFVNFADVSPELSREFRGLRLWLPLKLHGVQAFRDALDEKLDLTEYALGELTAMEGIEIVAEPQLTIIAFRLHPPGVDGNELNELNREFFALINESRRVALSPTILDGDFVMRMCIMHMRTHQEHVDWALDEIHRAADKLRG